MSYILEALKKAEAERELSQVPGLSTAQGNSTIYITHQSNTRAWWIAGGLALLLVAVVGAWVLRPTGGPVEGTPLAASPQPTTPVVAATPVQAPAPVPVPVPVQIPVATTSAKVPAATVAPEPLKPPSTKELPRTAVASVVVGAAPGTKPEPLKAPALTPAPASASATAPTPAPVRSVPANPIAVAVTPAPAAVTTAPASPEPPKPTVPVAARTSGSAVPAYGELPDALRKQIPALHISGAVYSDNPPEWTLIINDQIMSRGSQVAPDVRLEEVTASSAVFNFKGQRFRMDR